ncbi:MAG TPA: HD domain-containing protein, partial [candidate division Zixibacteria bacterium]|nr:HD domain-containing protein [candidate division Zixibacteria bacterium]
MTEDRIVTAEVVRNDPEIIDLVEVANRNLEQAGYTDHGFGHTEVVAKRAKSLMLKLGKDLRRAELTEIAALLHDIGNTVNRYHHAMLGALLAKPILMRLGMPFHEIHEVIAAIGNHHEGEGDP